MIRTVKKRKLLTSLCLCLAASFGLSAAVKAANGKVAIGRCIKAPVIDGELNDKCWQRAVTITPFLVNRVHKFAEEQTKAYVTYDNKNIYVGLKCFAKVLDPRQNRLHEFVDKVKENDSNDIYKDDCIVLLFAPDDKSCYEFTLNSNGTVADAECKAPAYWSNRDLKWNSNAQAAGSRQYGYWTAEIAIPRNAFLKNNTRNIKFMIGRINQATKEKSAFNRIDKGFHDQESFGLLVLKKAVAPVELGELPDFNVGMNKIQVKVKSSSNISLRIKQLLNQSGKKGKTFYDKIKLSEAKTFEVPLQVPAGEFGYRIILQNAVNSEISLETPEYSFSAAEMSISANIDSQNKYDLYVNGKNRDYKVNHGLNSLALKAEKGTKAGFTVNGEVFKLDSSWKFSPKAAANWNLADFNASAWVKAPVKDGILQQSGYLRKIIVIKNTEFWPNWNKYGVNICLDSCQQLMFPPRGITGVKNAVDFEMNIELPTGFELLGASSYYGNFKVACTKAVEVRRNGQVYNKYRISVPHNKRYIKELLPLHKYCMFAVKAPGKFGGTAFMYYYASAENSYIEEVPQKLKINLLPKLEGRQPKKIIIQLWGGWFGRLSDHELQNKVASYYVKAGYNEIQKLYIPVKGLREMALICFKPWGLNFAPLVAKYPEAAFVDSKLRKDPKKICPEFMLNNPEGKKYFDKVVGEWLKVKKVKHVDWDYEAPPFTSLLACYCPRCLKKFGHTASPEVIKKRYNKAWVEFMTSRMANVAGSFNKALHKADPEITFSVYSGYQNEHTKSYYGVDWSKLKGKVEVAMMGYGRSEENLRQSYRAIGNTQLVLGKIARPYDNKYRTYPEACTAAVLMRRLLDSKGGGILLFSLDNFDGRTFYATSLVSSLAAEYEDFFTTNKRIDSAVKCQQEYAVLESNGKKLLIVMNQSSKSIKFKAVLKKPHSIYDFYSKKASAESRYISGDILPGGIKAYIIK